MNIIGKSECNAAQMASYLINLNQSAKDWAYEYAKLYIEEGEAEGVRADGAWIQSCKETGNFKFIGGTAVTFNQNNFCGLGVVSKGIKGCTFDSPRLGIRAQIQHLKGYATKDPLSNPVIDPRYKYINKGCAPRFEDLAGKWAVPGYNTTKASSLEDAMNKGIGYGFDIIEGINKMKAIVVGESVEEVKYYRVQCGAFRSKSNAVNLQAKLKKSGFSAIIKSEKGLYKCQIGAFSKKSNAEMYLEAVKARGFDAFICYN